MIGSPPIPMKADSPRPRLHEVEADEGTEAPAPRDHPDPAGTEDVRLERGHEPDEALAGGDEARGVRPGDRGPVRPRRREHLHHVLHRDVLGEDDEARATRLDRIERGRTDPERRDE